MNSEWVTNLEKLKIWQDETFALLVHLSSAPHFVTLFLERRQGRTTLLLRLAAYFKEHGKTVQVLTPSMRTLEQFKPFISPPSANRKYDVCLIDDAEYCTFAKNINKCPVFAVITTYNINLAFGTVIRIPFFDQL